MDPDPVTPNADSVESNTEGVTPSVAQLVAEVYEAAPAAEKGRLLEHLLGPVGVLGLVAVADGIFAKIRFRGGWPQLHVRLEDAQNVQASDVATLVDYVQQISVQALDGLTQIISMSPTVTTSASAALLLTLLVQRKLNRHNE